MLYYEFTMCVHVFPSRVNLGDGISLAIGSTQLEDGATSQSFRNPYDISRAGLLDQLARMRTNFLHATPTTPNLIEDGTLYVYRQSILYCCIHSILACLST